MIPNYRSIHNRFKINNFHFDKEALYQLAYTLIKEGKDYENDLGVFLLDWLDDKETIQLTTSGTTGVPKVITIKKQSMVHSAIATGNFFNLHPQDKALLCLPARYIAGKMMIVRAMMLGLELDIMAPSSHLDDLLPRKNYDFIAIVPLQAENSLDKLHQILKKMPCRKNCIDNEQDNIICFATFVVYLPSKRTNKRVYSKNNI